MMGWGMRWEAAESSPVAHWIKNYWYLFDLTVVVTAVAVEVGPAEVVEAEPPAVEAQNHQHHCQQLAEAAVVVVVARELLAVVGLEEL